MKKKLFLLFCALVTVLGTRAQQHRVDLLAIGDPAPPLKVGGWIKGTPVTTFEKGEVYVVEFWATWCHPCIANFPHLSGIAEKYRSGKVDVLGISIFERKNVGIDSLRKFVEGPKGQLMRYNVAMDDLSGSMATNWVQSTGQRGIPFAIIIDKNGKVAWMGYPMLMDKPLEQIVKGDWDLKAVKAGFAENKRLDSIDVSMIPQFNGYINSKNFPEGLSALDSLVRKEPGIKYRKYAAHYRFVYLLHKDPEAAVAFVRKAWAANDIPDWKGVSDMVAYASSNKFNLTPAVYVLGVDALQAQIDHYPWSMDIPDTYATMAEWQLKAGNKQQAISAQEKAVKAAKERKGLSQSQIAAYESRLKEYQNM